MIPLYDPGCRKAVTLCALWVPFLKNSTQYIADAQYMVGNWVIERLKLNDNSWECKIKQNIVFTLQTWEIFVIYIIKSFNTVVTSYITGF